MSGARESGPAPRSTATDAAKSAGIVPLLLGLGVTTLLAAGAGLAAGSLMAGAGPAAGPPVAVPAADPAPVPTYAGELSIYPVEAVVTNLASPSNVWVRLESSIVYRTELVENPELTAGEIRQDILAYLRTLSLAQLGGPSALQHLREDLNERVHLRTRDRVKELVVQALIVQ